MLVSGVGTILAASRTVWSVRELEDETKNRRTSHSRSVSPSPSPAPRPRRHRCGPGTRPVIFEAAARGPERSVPPVLRLLRLPNYRIAAGPGRPGARGPRTPAAAAAAAAIHRVTHAISPRTVTSERDFYRRNVRTTVEGFSRGPARIALPARRRQ